MADISETTAARASSAPPGIESLNDLLEKLESLSGETVSKIDEAEGRAKALKLELVRQIAENKRLREENEKLKEEAERKGRENEELKGENGVLEQKNRDLEERWNVVQERLGPYNR